MHQLFRACLQKVSGGMRLWAGEQTALLSQPARALWQLWQGSHPGWWGTTDLSKIIPSITRGCDCCSFLVLSRGLRLSQATTPNSQASPGSGFREKVYRTQKGRWEQPQLLPTITKLVSSKSLSAVFINSGVWIFSTGLWKINEICAANCSLWQGKLCNEIDLCNSNTTAYTPPQF